MKNKEEDAFELGYLWACAYAWKDHKPAVRYLSAQMDIYFGNDLNLRLQFAVGYGLALKKLDSRLH